MLPLTESEYAALMRQRIEQSGLRIITDGPVPPLPAHLIPPIVVQNNGHHECHDGWYMDLPPILVMDVDVSVHPDETNIQEIARWRSDVRHDPYWLVGARIIDDWGPYPMPCDAASPIEAACVFAEAAQHLGSTMAHIDFHRWGHPRVQFYNLKRGNLTRIVASSFLEPKYNHHAVFGKHRITGTVPKCSVYVRRPEPPPAAPEPPPAPPPEPPVVSDEAIAAEDVPTDTMPSELPPSDPPGSILELPPTVLPPEAEAVPAPEEEENPRRKKPRKKAFRSPKKDKK
jgi:hypothetical protein